MLTFKARTEDRIMGEASGADDYITKPFSQEELIAKIEELLYA
jgi:DNA-binding response OmpR family regulator